MIIVIVFFLLSILLEGIMTNLLTGFLFFYIISLIVISYNVLSEKKYFVIIFIVGIIFDLIYTSTLFLHGFIFLFLGYLTKLISNRKDGYVKKLITYIILFLTYSLIMVVFTISYNKYDFYELIKIILNSFIINILYFSVVYFVINYLFCNRKKTKTY